MFKLESWNVVVALEGPTLKKAGVKRADFLQFSTKKWRFFGLNFLELLGNLRGLLAGDR